MDPRAELESIIRDSWAIYESTGDPHDEDMARRMEAEARELLALLPPARPKLKKSNKAKKRKAFKRHTRLNANSPILPQVRNLDRNRPVG